MATENFRTLTKSGRNSIPGFLQIGQRPANYSSLPTDLANHENRILDQQGPSCNWILFALCIISTLSDPLFFYIIVVNDKKKCVGLDEKLAMSAAVFRTVFDVFYITYSAFRPYIVVIIYGRNNLHRIGRTNARNYFLRSSFFKALPSCLPIPQVVIFVIIRKTRRGSEFFSTLALLKGVIISQYVPRLHRVYQKYAEAERTLGILAQVKLIKASCCLFIFLLAAHVCGDLWYLMAVEKETECWTKACMDDTECASSLFYCDDSFGDYTFINEYCPTMERDAKKYNFGIFHEALQSGIVEETNFLKRFIYCFRWGIQTLSCLGQNLETSTNGWENLLVCFIFILSLSLFLGVFASFQICLQMGTIRSEEMRFKAREIEQWETFGRLSQNLQQRVKNHQQFVWQETRGVDVKNLLNNLPRNLSKDIKRELCLEMVQKVPIFQRMEEELLDEICNCLKPVLYTDEYYIIKEGDSIGEMLFIIQGTLSIRTMTTDGSSNTCSSGKYLSNGDFWGKELPTYVLDPLLLSLPTSTNTVLTVTTVEAFTLKACDLREVVFEFWRVHNMRLPHIYRFYSPEWRTSKARVMQAAWRRYKKKKPHQTTMCGGNLSMLSADIYAAPFSSTDAHALGTTATRRKGALKIGTA